MRAPRLLPRPKRSRGLGKTGRKYAPPDREWLEYHFITLDMTTAEIGDIVDTSAVTVLKWLHNEGLGRNFTESMAKRRGRRSEGRGAYNYEARRILGEPVQCAWCGDTQRIEIHHVDHDWQSQSLENLIWLCVPCHRLEGRLWANRKRGKLEFYQEGNEIHITLLKGNV